MAIAKIEDAIEELRRGRPVIVVDDEDRENEGDVVVAAEKITPEQINFMARKAGGIICISMTGDRLDELELPLMVTENSARHETAFTISVDIKEGATTGTSAFDRAATILAMVDENAKPDDFARPGHIFPLRYAPGGVLVRAGHTEASVDLARLAGLQPAGVICEIMSDDGNMARMNELELFANEHKLLMVTIADLIAYRRQHEKLISEVANAQLPTEFGMFRAVAYKSMVDPAEHIALVMGDIDPEEPTLVRVHSECLTGDVFGSRRCDCGNQMNMALKAIGDAGKGVFVYMRQEGRGIGLHNKIKAYALQDSGLDTVDANIKLGFPPDLRWYGIGAQILVDLKVKKMRLLTNNPKKVVGLDAYGLELIEQLPIISDPTKENQGYLETKRQKMGHKL